MRTTLDRMADGGIHDQLGGGFCRYSVDAQWTIPHFEKMLYDNGPLLGAVRRPRARHRRAPLRGRRARHRRLAGARDARAGRRVLLEPRRRQRGRGGQVLRLDAATKCAPRPAPTSGRSPRRTSASTGRRTSRVTRGTCACREPLDARRANASASRCRTRRRGSPARGRRCSPRATRRVRPGRDDKILTSWNALADRRARARRARARRAALGRPRVRRGRCAEAQRRGATGGCCATRRGERADLNAYLDDHAFLLAALVELMQTRFRREDFAWARELADALLAHFEDRERGGFFFTSHDHETLFHRTKPGHDNATPSGNGVAARALIALGHLAARAALRRRGRARRAALRRRARRESPGGHSTLLAALAALERRRRRSLLDGRSPTTCAAWQRDARARRTARACACSTSGGARDLPAALVKGAAPAAGRGRVGLPRARPACRPIDALARRSNATGARNGGASRAAHARPVESRFRLEPGRRPERRWHADPIISVTESP